MSVSRCGVVRYSACSARTAPASPRSFVCCAVCCVRRAARRASPAPTCCARPPGARPYRLYGAALFAVLGTVGGGEPALLRPGLWSRPRGAGTRDRNRTGWFDLADAANTVAGQLPLGLKQRLALAAALLHEPDILFLDEPTSGVDPLTRRDFWARIGLLADSGVTILVTSHFMDEAEYCDRLGIVNQGRFAAVDTPAALRARVRSPSTARPHVGGRVHRVGRARDERRA